MVGRQNESGKYYLRLDRLNKMFKIYFFTGLRFLTSDLRILTNAVGPLTSDL